MDVPFADRYWMDIAIMMLTYIMLGWGLNIVIGLAGLLDLGYVAFYAVGAYSYALFAIHFGWSQVLFAKKTKIDTRLNLILALGGDLKQK